MLHHRPYLQTVGICWALLLLASCLEPRADDPRFTNYRALESSLARPAAGKAADRTYWNPAYANREFGSIHVTEPRIQAPAVDDVDYQRYLEDLRESLTIGMRQALAESKKFRRVTVDGAGTEVTSTPGAPDLRCRVEALSHISLLGSSIRLDPAFRDPRSKILVIASLEDPQTGEVVFKYTQYEYSQWENAGWAMKDLPAKAFDVAKGLRDALKEW